MPDIYATVDGRATDFNTTGWEFNRDASSCNSVCDTEPVITRDTATFGASKQAGRGGNIWSIVRTYMTFDTEDITVAPSEAILKVYGFYVGNADCIIVKANYGSSLTTADFDAIVDHETPFGASDGSGAGTLVGTDVVAYSSAFTSGWSTSGYNDITLNAAARSVMASVDIFQICIMDYDHDYLDIEPSSGEVSYSGCYFSGQSGTSKDPHINYTAGTATATHNATFFGTNF